MKSRIEQDRKLAEDQLEEYSERIAECEESGQEAPALWHRKVVNAQEILAHLDELEADRAS